MGGSNHPSGGNFTDSAELKLTALEMMFSEKVTLWEAVERGIESTKPASAKLPYMLEDLKAIGFRRKAKSIAPKTSGYSNPLDVNDVNEDKCEYDGYGYDYDIDVISKGKPKGGGKAP